MTVLRADTFYGVVCPHERAPDKRLFVYRQEAACVQTLQDSEAACVELGGLAPVHQLSDCNVTSAKPNPQEFVLVTEVP